ncbi:MAG TPA: DUF481 domain-containing protein [Thermoanaerobaculia bacterium]|nr:DUF481 domain-containing protein [Thermoanaerobaculia bacterium]
MRSVSAAIVLAAVLGLAAPLGAQPASPPPASGADSIDVVEMKNGDRISGEIKSYSEGRLFVSAPEGDINVKWNKIVSIRSVKQFEIETTAGLHHFGSLAASDPPGRLLLRTGSGSLTIDFFDVVRITPIYQTFFRRIDGSLDLGMNYTHASDLLQFDVTADAKFRKPKFVVLADLSLFYSRQNGETTSQRGNLMFTYIRMRPNRWVSGGLVGFENNRDLGLQLRETAGVFGGRFLVLKNQTNLVATVGLMGNHEKGTSGESDNNLEGAVDARYSTFTYDYPKLWFDAYLRVVPGITDAPRVRVDANVKLKREIVMRDFYLSISVFYNYDSVPPASHAVKSDWGPILSIGWTF